MHIFHDDIVEVYRDELSETRLIGEGQIQEFLEVRVEKDHEGKRAFLVLCNLAPLDDDDPNSDDFLVPLWVRVDTI